VSALYSIVSCYCWAPLVVKGLRPSLSPSECNTRVERFAFKLTQKRAATLGAKLSLISWAERGAEGD
jgi:hypothetical protein